jgi:hypothetical protein
MRRDAAPWRRARFRGRQSAQRCWGEHTVGAMLVIALAEGPPALLERRGTGATAPLYWIGEPGTDE